MNRILTKAVGSVQAEDPTPLPTARRHPRLPGYEVLEELRRGGTGIVYKARQLQSGQVVALKVIRHGFDESTARRCYAEVRAQTKLQHPNIVPIHEVKQDNERFFLAMPLLPGSLSQKLEGHTYTPRDAAELMKTLALTVQFAHDSDIIHRDLKPSNILLDEDGTPRIADFGLAKNLIQSSGATSTGDILGTPSYMAPEQATGRNKEIGPATDVYALGATLYELLTGRPPFVGEEALERVLLEEPVPPSRVRSGVPRPLETICLHCLKKRPEQRYPSAQALADDLDNFLEGRRITAPPSGWLVRVWQLFRSHLWFAS
jgi:serine/threonine protein kinase